MKHSTIFSFVVALPAVHGIAFGGPAPTDTNPDRALDGTTPKPTLGPSVNELRKRQTNLYPETCGWVDGDLSSGVSCSVGRTCMLYKSAATRMAGCCGLDTQNCGWSNSCVDYSKYAAGSCGSNCILDPFVRKCTNAAMPYCVTWTYPGDGIADYGCAATSRNTVYTVRQNANDGLGGTTSIRLPTLSGSAVTGFGGTATGTPYTGTSSRTTVKKKLAVSTIIGIVVAVLFLLFFVIVGVFMFLKKKKKQQQIAQNAQVVAAAQATRPQSQYPQPGPPPPQMQQPIAGGFVPPMPPQSPQPTVNGYFSPPGQQENKFNAHKSVHEYAISPISVPSTPAPQYSQPGVPLMPQQPTRYQSPVGGAYEVPAAGVTRPHEVDATSVPRAPNTSGPVYEIGHGR